MNIFKFCRLQTFQRYSDKKLHFYNVLLEHFNICSAFEKLIEFLTIIYHAKICKKVSQMEI